MLLLCVIFSLPNSSFPLFFIAICRLLSIFWRHWYSWYPLCVEELKEGAVLIGTLIQSPLFIHLIVSLESRFLIIHSLVSLLSDLNISIYIQPHRFLISICDDNVLRHNELMPLCMLSHSHVTRFIYNMFRKLYIFSLIPVTDWLWDFL